MSAPEIPERTQEEALTDLLESIALEETALAHILNAEGKKIQAIAGMMEEGTITSEEAIEQQEAIIRMLRMPIKKQMLLQFKLEDVLDFKEELELPPEPPVEVQTNTVTANGIYENETYTDEATAYYNSESVDENNTEGVNSI
ncbi:hypothetical protein [Fuchsiella alkaliacetigena]|uniref:hypothetical protein n=1 Tax=Fuchsiella alkaliacetigena TaxID=957042 RepID=UPI00200A9F2A|nr:hypothetical protein [Fuchsiella alkaliacetigena]MCK8823777.1 hypothetical protein [Fuchsiella alkaliacetigena]